MELLGIPESWGMNKMMVIEHFKKEKKKTFSNYPLRSYNSFTLKFQLWSFHNPSNIRSKVPLLRYFSEKAPLMLRKHQVVGVEDHGEFPPIFSSPAPILHFPVGQCKIHPLHEVFRD